MSEKVEPVHPYYDGRENFYGLTKREYFAAHAPEMPTWYLDRKVFAHTAKEKLAVLVSWRWDYADAMIAGRGR